MTLDSAGNVVSYDIETQCRAVFENVRFVLEDAGANWNDIVDVTVFLTNMKKDFRIYNKHAEHFAGDGKPNPTRTTIEVGALPTPIAIELKVIAATAWHTPFLSFRAKSRNLAILLSITSRIKSMSRSQPFRIIAADHTGITVSNLERSLAFWRDVLGFELSHTAHQTGEMASEITGVAGAEIACES